MSSAALCFRSARAYTRNSTKQSILLARTFASTARRHEINKVFPSASEALKDMKPNSTLLCGGFGLCGVPDTLIDEVLTKKDITGITAVSNNAGTDESGLGKLLKTKQISKMIASYIGENKTFEKMYLTGEVELELTPQGTLAERCASGGKGIPAFYTPAAFGTVVQTGELPLRNNADGTPKEYSYPKDVKVFDGKQYLLEESIKGDYAFVKAWKADKLGNCQFRLAANNFNGAMGRNAKMTIVEAEEIVEPGGIAPEAVHLPGIYVKRVIQSLTAKNIEKFTFATDPNDPSAKAALGSGDTAAKRERIVRRAAKEFKNGMYANLGIGMPMLAPSFVGPEVEVQLQSENGILGLGPYPVKGKEDADLINAGKETVTLKPGAAVFGSEESFGMIRSGRVDLTILGAMQVSGSGDLANWMLPGKVKGFGGAMDLVSNPSKTKVVVTMEHTDKKGNAKILKQCAFPLTGKACVSMIITELGVFEVDFATGLTLTEIADGVTVDEIKSKTEAPFKVADDLKPMLGIPSTPNYQSHFILLAGLNCIIIIRQNTHNPSKHHPSTMSTTPAFPLFPTLPTELRLKIYTHILHLPSATPRILKISPFAPTTFSNTPPPITLSICAEARALTLASYSYLELGTQASAPGSKGGGPLVPVDWETQTLYISNLTPLCK
ncbi:Succinyl-CoA:3-ketoacid coenzyme A transferase 1, mitochondrial [Lachnellula cervina]|uniref:Succinyl-CoA:3-ketoacid coenzyme A transferase 1, mitochondrial n=1 Tax=Lachnellula cervina TaxID=1316786 RepID=A0A7D8URF5_9HELO|nr:Succinyl-CoA:3-ketoacid coenzyme A transferase 1, mitochondrial [Lachnellula cervina]